MTRRDDRDFSVASTFAPKRWRMLPKLWPSRLPTFSVSNFARLAVSLSLAGSLRDKRTKDPRPRHYKFTVWEGEREGEWARARARAPPAASCNPQKSSPRPRPLPARQLPRNETAKAKLVLSIPLPSFPLLLLAFRAVLTTGAMQRAAHSDFRY